MFIDNLGLDECPKTTSVPKTDKSFFHHVPVQMRDYCLFWRSIVSFARQISSFRHQTRCDEDAFCAYIDDHCSSPVQVVRKMYKTKDVAKAVAEVLTEAVTLQFSVKKNVLDYIHKSKELEFDKWAFQIRRDLKILVNTQSHLISINKVAKPFFFL